jgi:hypothetical protein
MKKWIEEFVENEIAAARKLVVEAEVAVERVCASGRYEIEKIGSWPNKNVPSRDDGSNWR